MRYTGHTIKRTATCRFSMEAQAKLDRKMSSLDELKPGSANRVRANKKLRRNAALVANAKAYVAAVMPWSTLGPDERYSGYLEELVTHICNALVLNGDTHESALKKIVQLQNRELNPRNLV